MSNSIPKSRDQSTKNALTNIRLVDDTNINSDFQNLNMNDYEYDTESESEPDSDIESGPDKSKDEIDYDQIARIDFLKDRLEKYKGRERLPHESKLILMDYVADDDFDSADNLLEEFYKDKPMIQNNDDKPNQVNVSRVITL